MHIYNAPWPCSPHVWSTFIPLCPLILLHALKRSHLNFHAMHISTILWIFAITRIHRKKICNICLLRIGFNSFDMIISSSIQLLAKTTWFHSSLWLNKIPLCLYAMSSLSNPLISGWDESTQTSHCQQWATAWLCKCLYDMLTSRPWPQASLWHVDFTSVATSISVTCWLHVCGHTSISVTCWLWALC